MDMEPDHLELTPRASLDSYDLTEFQGSFKREPPSITDEECYLSRIILSYADLQCLPPRVFINDRQIDLERFGKRSRDLNEQELQELNEQQSGVYYLPEVSDQSVSFEFEINEAQPEGAEIHISRIGYPPDPRAEEPPRPSDSVFSFWQKFWDKKCQACKQIIRWIITLMQGGLDAEEILILIADLLEEIGIDIPGLGIITDLLEKYGKRRAADIACKQLGPCSEQNEED